MIIENLTMLAFHRNLQTCYMSAIRDPRTKELVRKNRFCYSPSFFSVRLGYTTADRSRIGFALWIPEHDRKIMVPKNVQNFLVKSFNL